MKRKKVISLGFWIFMLIMDVMIPITMIGFGQYFLKKAPKEINAAFGYRTNMSMKNRDTWEFAHNYCGSLWFRSGLILLPLSIIVLLCFINKSNDIVGIAGVIVCAISMIPLIGAIYPTEKALQKTFDQNGKRR